MTISTERITNLTGTDFNLIAHFINLTIHRNPETGGADMRAEFIELLDIDGVARNVNYGKFGRVERTWDEFKNTTPAYAGTTDPVTGADLTNISMKGVISILLDAADRAYAQDNPIS